MIFKKLHWIALLFCLFYINQVNGQTEVTIVDGALSDYDHVFDEYYNYSHVQYIYDKALISQSGTITDLKFEHTNFICTTNSIRIYLGNSTKTSFTGGTDWINSGLTLVYTGSVTPANGWYNIDITDFVYDNTYNLIIAIDNDDGIYCGTSDYEHYYTTTAVYTMLRDHASSDVGDYGSISSFGSRQAELASLKLIFLSTTPCSGIPAAGTAQATVTSGCAVYTTTLSVLGASTDADIIYQWQMSSDSIVWTDIPGATTPSYIASVTGTTWYRRNSTCTNSGLSDTSVPVKTVAECYTMSNVTITTCSGNFYDSGGPSANYNDDEDYIMTFCTENENEYIKFVFNTFYTESYDRFYVYDGPDTLSPLIFRLSGQAVGSDVPPDIISSDSCITFWFDSDGSTTYSGWNATITCTPEPNTIARDYCVGAAHICNLNGYTGKTSSFYNKDFPGNMCDIDEGPSPCSLFLGNIHNNSWISFIASDTSATFEVTVSNCTLNEGIQLGVYSGTDCDNFALLSDPQLTSGTVGDSTALYNNATHIVTVPFDCSPALIPGNMYYIMIDGQSGDVCDYSIAATSGVELAGVDISDTTICYGTSITITATGGTNFIWSTSPADTNSSLTVNPDSSTTYWVTISGGNPECPDMVAVFSTININPLPDVIIAPSSQTLCSGEASLNIQLNSGLAGTNFNWSRTEPPEIITGMPVSGTNIPSGGIIPTYNFQNTGTASVDIVISITPVSSESCEGSSNTTTITVNPIPNAAVTGYTEPTSCGGNEGSISVTNSPSYIYQWNTVPVQTISSATGLTAGNYTVTVSLGGCDATLNQSLTDPGSPVVTISANDSIVCSNDSVIFTASGISTGYYVFFVDGDSAQGPSSDSIFSSTQLTNGQNIYVQGVESGCTGSSTAIIMTVNNMPVTTLTNALQTICSGETTAGIMITGSLPGTLYNWIRTNPSGIITTQPLSGSGLSNGDEISGTVFFNNSGTTQTVEYTIYSEGPAPTLCSGIPVTATIIINPLPVIDTIIVSEITVCIPPWDGTIIANVSSGTEPYQYSCDGGAFTNDSIFTGLTQGIHTIAVIDNQGCQVNNTVNIGSVAGIVIDSIKTTDILCYGDSTGQIIVYAENAQYFSINGMSPQNDSLFTGLPAGNYTVTVTDAGGCTDISSAGITEPDSSLSILLNRIDVLCKNDSTGMAQAIINGGTSPYDYLWNTGVQTQGIASLPAGIYSITVTDANNCTTVSNIEISEPDTALNVLLNKTDVLCKNDSTGMAQAIINGGTSPYDYLWNTGVQTQGIASLPAGIYSIT
ncbi:MAG: hypothetical protein HY738_06515, partial [Bacteroidia bacterium]|nr:hypothetical protein [Bacteroidia bacterium]